MRTLIDILKEELPLFDKSINQFKEIYEDVKSIELNKNLQKGDLYLLDTYSSRFARCIDVFENKILKTIAAIVDGRAMTALDVFNKMEQLKIISDAKQFYKIKQLRNRMVHEYAEKDWLLIISAAVNYAPTIIESYQTTINYCIQLINNEKIE
jgi:uncharacterized protein YutE (UPF0331/DUF86 family)